MTDYAYTGLPGTPWATVTSNPNAGNAYTPTTATPVAGDNLLFGVPNQGFATSGSFSFIFNPEGITTFQGTWTFNNSMFSLGPDNLHVSGTVNIGPGSNIQTPILQEGAGAAVNIVSSGNATPAIDSLWVTGQLANDATSTINLQGDLVAFESDGPNATGGGAGTFVNFEGVSSQDRETITLSPTAASGITIGGNFSSSDAIDITNTAASSVSIGGSVVTLSNGGKLTISGAQSAGLKVIDDGRGGALLYTAGNAPAYFSPTVPITTPPAPPTTGITKPLGMNDALFTDTETIATQAKLSTTQEQGLIVNVNRISELLSEFHAQLRFVPNPVKTALITAELEITSTLNLSQSRSLANDIIANPFAGSTAPTAQPTAVIPGSMSDVNTAVLSRFTTLLHNIS